MHVTRTERPARAEALARAEPIRRLHPVTVLVVVTGLLVTAALVIGSSIVHDNNEQRLLEQRGHEAATVAASSVIGLRGDLRAASVAAAPDRLASTITSSHVPKRSASKRSSDPAASGRQRSRSKTRAS